MAREEVTVSYEAILVERFGAIERISHNRPQARNAESRLLLEELDAAMGRAVADDGVRVIVLAATGDHFSAGHDLKEAQRERADFSVEQRWSYEEQYYFDYCLRIFNAPKPTIAQVQGACISGGFMVANMCDIVIAADDAFFADPVAHTLGASAVEVLVHPWVLGHRKAREMLYTGGRLTAAEAEAAGMINHVVPRAELEARTFELAERIATAPPFALRLLKRSLNRSLEAQGFAVALAAHFDTHQLSHVSEAFKAARDRGLSSAIRKDSDA